MNLSEQFGDNFFALLKTELKYPSSKLIEAFRMAVRAQLIRYKYDRTALPVCAICGQTITDKAYEIHHSEDFPISKMVDTFLLDIGISPDDVPVYKTEKGRIILNSPVIESQWKDYHEVNAKLETVHKQCHAIHHEEVEQWTKPS